MAAPIGSLTSQERHHLAFFDPALGWGTIKSHSDLAISAPLKKDKARELAYRLNKIINTSSYQGDFFPFKGLPEKQQASPHYLIIPRSLINTLALPLAVDIPNLNTLALTSNVIESDIRPLEDFDRKEHPVKELNRREILDPEYVQKSFIKKLARAQEDLTNFSIDRSFRSEVRNPKANKTSFAGKTENLHYGYTTTPNGKFHNEDVVIVSSLSLKIANEAYSIPLFGVLDGHSQKGHEGKDVAEFIAQHLADNLQHKLQTAINKLSGTITSEQFDVAIFNCLKLSFVELSEQACTYQKTRKKSDTEIAGTTATLSLIFNDHIYTACAGDSRAIFSNPSSIIALSKDRKLIPPKETNNEVLSQATPEETIEYFDKQLTQEKFNRSIYNRGSGLLYNPSKKFLRTYWGLSVIKALGHDEIKEGSNPRPDITKQLIIESEGRKFIVIASDGLWDVLSSTEVSEAVQTLALEENSCKTISEKLTTMAEITKNADNISVLVVELPQPIDEITLKTLFPDYIWEKQAEVFKSEKLSKSNCIALSEAINKNPNFYAEVHRTFNPVTVENSKLAYICQVIVKASTPSYEKP